MHAPRPVANVGSPLTISFWTNHFTICLEEGLTTGGREHGHGSVQEGWHCPYCQKDARAQDLLSHIEKAAHLSWKQYMTHPNKIEHPPPEWGDPRLYEWGETAGGIRVCCAISGLMMPM